MKVKHKKNLILIVLSSVFFMSPRVITASAQDADEKTSIDRVDNVFDLSLYKVLGYPLQDKTLGDFCEDCSQKEKNIPILQTSPVVRTLLFKRLYPHCGTLLLRSDNHVVLVPDDNAKKMVCFIDQKDKNYLRNKIVHLCPGPNVRVSFNYHDDGSGKIDFVWYNPEREKYHDKGTDGKDVLTIGPMPSKYCKRDDCYKQKRDCMEHRTKK